MKVKIIATGEIKEVLKRKSFPIEYIDGDGNVYMWDQVKEIEDNSIDWEQRRYEIARDCLAAMSVNFNNSPDNFYGRCRGMVVNARVLSDILIEQLKGA